MENPNLTSKKFLELTKHHKKLIIRVLFKFFKKINSTMVFCQFFLLKTINNHGQLINYKNMRKKCIFLRKEPNKMRHLLKL